MTIEKGTTNTDKMAVFARVDAAAQSEMKNLAWGLLRKPDTHPVSDKPVTVKVSDALYLWNTRLKNTRLTHRPIRGAELLVDQLRTMASDTELEQIGFKSPKQAANLFFDRKSGEFVGLILVDIPESARSVGNSSDRPPERAAE
ncbi:MAG: hypothetical protein QOD93_2779 [Acetobacteraceae bacterium]|jgi:hypothetical protein|nr:hypothetical protein [Rhodopila sp.]MEA2732732.1 hypothetical protein [Acetobacteraceae bacterium]MEA2769817.1 hypothetical protein [Acetobacteraceae bacterium]